MQIHNENLDQFDLTEQFEADWINRHDYTLRIHVGQVLQDEFLMRLGISRRQLAHDIQIPEQRIDEIIEQRRDLSPATALLLGHYFGNDAQYWLNIQMVYQIQLATECMKETLQNIRPFGWMME